MTFFHAREFGIWTTNTLVVCIIYQIKDEPRE